MPTKTTKKKRKTRADGDPAKGTMRLRGNLKLQYAAAVYSLQAANAKLETTDSEMARRAENDEAFADALRLLSKREAQTVDVSKAISKVHTVAKKVCDKYNIPFEEFRDYVVDTETGQITHAPNTGEPKG